jgi:hypothetical protein
MATLTALAQEVIDEGAEIDDPIRIAFTEGHYYHARCLIEFFGARKRAKKDRWYPRDFGVDWKLSDLDMWRARLAFVDQTLSHLSKQRAKPPRLKWDIDQVAQDLIGLYEDFVKQVPDRRRRTFLHEGVIVARTRLPLHQPPRGRVVDTSSATVKLNAWRGSGRFT